MSACLGAVGRARRGGVRVSLLAAIAAFLISGGAIAQKQGGSIAAGLESDVNGFDPLKVGVYDNAATMVAATLFESLTRPDANGKAAPSLAVSWTHSEDYRAWTFKLRPNVKFHDGTHFDAAAVKWNIDRQKDPANKCRCASYLTNLLRVEAFEPLTVVFHLKDPRSDYPEVLMFPRVNSAMHSPSAIQARGDAYNRNPVGTGAFVLKSWTAGDRIVVERNPNYWSPGIPRLDRIVFRPLPDGPARFSSLMSGEVDLIHHDMFDFDNLKKAKADRRFTVHEDRLSGAWPVAAFNTKVAPLDDVRVRRALVMAIDRQKMSQALTGGIARPATNPYGDGSWVKCSDDGALPYDPAKARELLREYGKPVEFRMVFTATPRGRAIGQVLQQFWKQVGANMEIEQIDQAAFPARAFQRQYQSISWRIVDVIDPQVQLVANFRTGSPLALANYSNPKLDEMLDRAGASADMRIRNADYCEVGRLINQEAIWFWLFQNNAFAIGKAKLKGVPRLYGDVVNLSAAWLE